MRPTGLPGRLQGRQWGPPVQSRKLAPSHLGHHICALIASQEKGRVGVSLPCFAASLLELKSRKQWMGALFEMWYLDSPWVGYEIVICRAFVTGQGYTGTQWHCPSPGSHLLTSRPVHISWYHIAVQSLELPPKFLDASPGGRLQPVSIVSKWSWDSYWRNITFCPVDSGCPYNFPSKRGR